MKVNNLVIFINGRAGVGKDTFVNYCREYAEANYPCEVINIHRSDRPKKALEMLGWDGKKNGESRKLLVELVDFGEKFNMTNSYLKNHMKSSSINSSSPLRVIFYHVRDPQIIDSLKKDLDTNRNDTLSFSVLIKRDSENLEPDVWGIESYEYNLYVEAQTLEGSKKAAESFIKGVLDVILRVGGCNNE